MPKKTVIHKSLRPLNPTHPYMGQLSQIKQVIFFWGGASLMFHTWDIPPVVAIVDLSMTQFINDTYEKYKKYIPLWNSHDIIL